MRFSKTEIDSLDIDWFAVDQEGFVGHFTSGSSCILPESVASSKDENEFLLDYFLGLEEQSSYELNDVPKLTSNSKPVPGIILESYFEMGRRGLFSFVASEDLNNQEGKYICLLKPLNPLKIEAVPKEVQKILKKTNIKAENFLHSFCNSLFIDLAVSFAIYRSWT
ncbi:MAG: hypothetical protein GY757_42000 [bacterium]|nr:hypothetical protein [bacterium]